RLRAGKTSPAKTLRKQAASALSARRSQRSGNLSITGSRQVNRLPIPSRQQALSACHQRG
ncbi:hypothetical protein AAHK20_33210, partial [Trinickia sp. YCB016]